MHWRGGTHSQRFPLHWPHFCIAKHVTVHRPGSQLPPDDELADELALDDADDALLLDDDDELPPDDDDDDELPLDEALDVDELVELEDDPEPLEVELLPLL